MPAERDWPACSPPGSGFPKPVHPGPGVQGSPQPQSPSLAKALGGVEPRSHCLPVSLARLKTAVTRTEKAAPARGLQGSGHGTAKPGPPGPLAPGDASLHAPGAGTDLHCAPSRGFGEGSRLAHRPVAHRVASAPYLCTLRPPQRQGRKLPAGALAQLWEPRTDAALILGAPPPAVSRAGLQTGPAKTYLAHPPTNTAPGAAGRPLWEGVTYQVRCAPLVPVIQRPEPRRGLRVLFSARGGKSRQQPPPPPATSPEPHPTCRSLGWGCRLEQ